MLGATVMGDDSVLTLTALFPPVALMTAGRLH